MGEANNYLEQAKNADKLAAVVDYATAEMRIAAALSDPVSARTVLILEGSYGRSWGKSRLMQTYTEALRAAGREVIIAEPVNPQPPRYRQVSWDEIRRMEASLSRFSASLDDFKIATEIKNLKPNNWFRKFEKRKFNR